MTANEYGSRILGERHVCHMMAIIQFQLYDYFQPKYYFPTNPRKTPASVSALASFSLSSSRSLPMASKASSSSEALSNFLWRYRRAASVLRCLLRILLEPEPGESAPTEDGVEPPTRCAVVSGVESGVAVGLDDDRLLPAGAKECTSPKDVLRWPPSW